MGTSSRYANAPSLFDLVQINLLNATSTASTVLPSTSTLFSDTSTIPEKRSRLQIAPGEEETVETDTQYHTPQSNFTNTQTSHDGQESRSSQTTAIAVDSEASNVPGPTQGDTRNSAASSFANINDHRQPSNISTSNDIHIVHDDNGNSDMSIDQEMGVAEESASHTSDRDESSSVKDEPNHQGSNATIITTTAQRQPSGTPFNRTTSYHSLELYEDIGTDEEGEEVFVDTSEILIDAEVEEEEEEQEESSQSSDEFYDVKEVFSATVSTTTTPTVIEEEADRQLQDDTTSVVMSVIEATVEGVQADVEQEEEESEILNQDDELGDEQEEPEKEREPDELTEESEDEQAKNAQERGDSGQAKDGAQSTDNVVEAQEREISQQSESCNVEATQESNTNEPALQSARIQGVSFNELEDGELDTSNDSRPVEAGVIQCDANESSVLKDTALNAVESPDNVEQLDTDETSEQHPSAIEENTSINASVTMQQQQQQPSEEQDTLLSVEQQDPVSTVGDQAVASLSMQDEQLNQNEQAQSSELVNQDNQLPALVLEDEQLIGIDEVQFLMDHQDEQMALHEPIEEELALAAMPELQSVAWIQDQQNALPSSAVVDTAHEGSSPDHDQQVQIDDDNNDTDESDQQVVNDENANTTRPQLLESDHAHSFLLAEIQDILHEGSEEAEEQQQQQHEQEFTVESEPTPPLPTQNDSDTDTVMSQLQDEMITDADDEDKNDSNAVADDDMDVEMQDAIVESESDEAIHSGSQSQVTSVMDDSVQDITNIRDSFAPDPIQNQSPFSQQSEAVEEYEQDESDVPVGDTQEPKVLIKREPRPAATAVDATSERIVIDLVSDSEEEVLAEDEAALRNVEFIDMSSMDSDYEEDDLMTDVLSDKEEKDEAEQQDVQTQEPVAVALDDVPSTCLEADLDAMNDRTVCSMDLPPYVSVPMWWYDAHDSNQTGIVYLFGKVGCIVINMNQLY